MEVLTFFVTLKALKGGATPKKIGQQKCAKSENQNFISVSALHTKTTPELLLNYKTTPRILFLIDWWYTGIQVFLGYSI